MKQRKGQKNGQILVLMALLSTTMIILFGMVVSIGHLVQAKVNLQNAVDLAAMSGASWQARFLNHISLVNYRMRQNYKFVLYDLYVTQSRFNRGLTPNQVNPFIGSEYGTFERLPKNQTTFGICQQAYGYTPRAPGEPGEGVDTTTDLCQNLEGIGGQGKQIPPIIPSPTPNPNPVLLAANAAILALKLRVESLCSDASGQNEAYFNYIMAHLQNRQRMQMGEMLNVLINFDKSFSKDDDVFRGSGFGDQTISKTFRANLISANNTGSLQLEYLNPYKTRAFRNEGADAQSLNTKIFGINPPQGTFAEYFERQRVRFHTKAADFGPTCSTKVIDVISSDFTILGLSRSRNYSGGTNSDPDPVKIPFSVVIRASVTPNLLFWPQSLTPTLVAVGAAKPFGSRLGPPMHLTNYELSGVQNQYTENTNASFANMSYYPGDAGTLTDPDPFLPGVGHKRILQYLMRQLPKPNFGNGSGVNDLRPSISQPAGGLDCAPSDGRPAFLCLSLAPTLYEGLFWNVFPYPPQTYASSPAIQAEFPSDILLKVATPGLYYMPDRMPGSYVNPPPAELEKWHTTVLIGKTPYFRDSGTNKPVFFADPFSSASSWSPDYEFDASDLDPQGATTTGGTYKGRTGYQIKLTSLKEICSEIIAGGGVQPGQQLQPYCSPGASEVFH